MPIRHFSQHGASPTGDALDALRNQNDLVASLLIQWASNDVDQQERGTLVKLILEHAAVREAAVEEVADALGDLGRDDDASRLTAGGPEQRRLIADLDKLTQGRQPAAIAARPEVVTTISDLASSLDGALHGAGSELVADLGNALSDDDRSGMSSASYVRKHAPTRPAAEPAWYDRLSAGKRIHAAYDRLRSFPWPESAPLMDEKLADDYDQEV